MTARREIDAIYPLSPQQEGMLLQSLHGNGDGLFIEQEVHTLMGPVDADRFERAWRDLLGRHAMLRTAFTWRTRTEPLQVVFRDVPIPLQVDDWRRCSATEQQQRLEEYLRAERARGFDFSRPPLLRLRLIRTSDSRHELVWTQHHILYDGWCRAVLFEELTRLYGAQVNGSPASLPQAAQYGSYIEWLRGQDLDAAKRFWRRELEGITTATPLGRPAEGHIPLTSPPSGYQEESLRCPAGDMTALDRFARKNRATAGAVVQAVWAVLLARYTGLADVVLGVTVSGRPPDLPGVETIVGPFMNTLPVRIQVRADVDFCTLVHELHAHHAELRQYEYCSSAQIHDWSGVPGAIPLYEHVLVYENYPGAANQPRTEATESRPPESRFVGARTAYPLTLLIAPADDLVLRGVFDSRRLTTPDVRRMLEHLATMLRHASTDADVRVSDLFNLVVDQDVPRYRTALRTLGEPVAAAACVPPANAIEARVASIAAEVLGLPRVSMTGRFLDLGGHSLMATRFVSRLRAAIGIEIPLRLLFDSVDLRAFAAAVEQDIVQKVDSLSEEEAARLLEAMDKPD